jgi:hypothetical protein
MLFLVFWIGLALAVILIRRRIVDGYLAAVVAPDVREARFSLDPAASWRRSQEVMRALHMESPDRRLEAKRRRALAVQLLFPVIALAMIFPAVWAATLLDGMSKQTIALDDSGFVILVLAAITSVGLIRSHRRPWQLVGVVCLVLVGARSTLIILGAT